MAGLHVAAESDWLSNTLIRSYPTAGAPFFFVIYSPSGYYRKITVLTDLSANDRGRTLYLSTLSTRSRTSVRITAVTVLYEPCTVSRDMAAVVDRSDSEGSLIQENSMLVQYQLRGTTELKLHRPSSLYLS
jgi:hypothetical protein